MRHLALLALAIFLFQVVFGISPLPEDWRDALKIVPVELELEPKPRPHRWHVPIKRSPLD